MALKHFERVKHILPNAWWVNGDGSQGRIEKNTTLNKQKGRVAFGAVDIYIYIHKYMYVYDPFVCMVTVKWFGEYISISPNWLISGSDSYVTAMLVYQRVFVIDYDRLF